MDSHENQRRFHDWWKSIHKTKCVRPWNQTSASRSNGIFYVPPGKNCAMAESQFVGASFADKMEDQQVLRVGITFFKQMGFNTTTSTSLMHVFLINALGNTMALDSKVVPSSTSSSSFGFFGMLMAFTFTMFCLFIGFEHGLDPSENHWAFEGT